MRIMLLVTGVAWIVGAFFFEDNWAQVTAVGVLWMIMAQLDHLIEILKKGD